MGVGTEGQRGRGQRAGTEGESGRDSVDMSMRGRIRLGLGFESGFRLGLRVRLGSGVRLGIGVQLGVLS